MHNILILKYEYCMTVPSCLCLCKLQNNLGLPSFVCILMQLLLAMPTKHTRDESLQMDKSSCIYDHPAIKADFCGSSQDVSVLLLISDVCRRVERDRDRRGGSERSQDGHRALRRAIQLHQRETETTNSGHLLQER